MFRRLSPVLETRRFYFNDREIVAQANDTVAAALLASGIGCFGRHPGSGADRGPFCMMGGCFECLVEIDGQSVQACQVVVTEGLQVQSHSIASSDTRD